MANEKFLKESGLTQAVTSIKAYVDARDTATLNAAKTYFDDNFVTKIQAAGAMVLRGSVSSAGQLPSTVGANGAAIGDTYVVAGVATTAVMAGETVRNGDTIICTGKGANAAAQWTVVQNNVDVAGANKLGLVKGGTTSGKTYGVSVAADGSMTVGVPCPTTAEVATQINNSLLSPNQRLAAVETALGATTNDSGDRVYDFSDGTTNYLQNGEGYATIKAALHDMDGNIHEAVAAITRNNYGDVYTKFNDNYTLSAAEVLAICNSILNPAG